MFGSHTEDREMLNIAICDDEVNICGIVERMVIQLFEEQNIECETDTFISGKSLCEEMRRTEYDILFLDIEIPDMGGIEIGKFIREELNNQDIQIAYISSKTQYAMELFDYRPINFFLILITKEMIKEKIIDKFIALNRHNQFVFSYKKGFEHYRISLNDIIYFKKDVRKVHVISKKGKDTFYGSMEQIYSELKNYNFLFIHKSVIVNYMYIAKIRYTEVEMMDGEVFSISQSRRSAIRKQCLEMSEREKW